MRMTPFLYSGVHFSNTTSLGIISNLYKNTEFICKKLMTSIKNSCILKLLYYLHAI